MFHKKIILSFALLIGSGFNLFSGRSENRLKPNFQSKGARKESSRSNTVERKNGSHARHWDKSTSRIKQPKFIYDECTDRRGKPKMLKILCSNCDHFLMNYQKDGVGRLLRCYLDRIHSPEELTNLQDNYYYVRELPSLVCKECSHVIGTPMVYESENRLTYKMNRNSFYFE